jgi:steroid delta-isomerase
MACCVGRQKSDARSATFFSAGATLIWEYPRVTPEGDQVEIVEVMETADSLIQHHRIYWGWKGCLLIAPKLVPPKQ